MRYLVLNIAVLLPIIVIAVISKRLHAKAVVAALIIICVLTAVFDSLIIKSGIVGYNLEHILGVYIWRAPIEDFAYAIASVLLVGLLWERYEK